MLLIARSARRLPATVAFFQAAGFQARGFAVLDTTPHPLALAPDVTDLLVTSQEALPALPTPCPPLHVVGAQTAAVARAQGFAVAHVGPSTAAALADQLATGSLAGRVFVHAAGDRAADAWAPLRAAGATVRTALAYTTRDAAALPPDVVCDLAENRVSFALVFSPESGATLRRLVAAAGLMAPCGIAALSPAVAAGFDGWHVRTAADPTLEGLRHVLAQP
jgi:uroporphyrinogen-III synthase